MLEQVVDFLGEYGNLLPRYTGQRCLVERQAVGGCSACADICPHEAITIQGRVEIDPQRCTGCGLCVQSCPTGALEYDLLPMLNLVREQGSSGAPVACSRSSVNSGIGGEALHCLGRVTEAAVVAAGGWNVPLTLVHGDCASCDIGGPQVPEQLEAVIEQAQVLRMATGRSAQVQVGTAQQAGAAPQVTRRGLFGALARVVRTAAVKTLPESPLPFVDWSVPQERRPAEWLWRKRALKPTPPPAQGFWPAPIVKPGCIECPVCVNVCPTSAIHRSHDGGFALLLDVQACTGCNACVRSCPPQVMELELYPEEAFGEGKEVMMYPTEQSALSAQRSAQTDS